MSINLDIELAGLLKLATDTISKFEELRRNTNEKSWEEIIITLDMLEELTPQHIEAINKVVQPILKNGDIQSTTQRYYELVNNPVFPNGYSYAHGILDGAQEKFKKGSIHDNLNIVNNKLHNFRFAAFLLTYGGLYDTGRLSGRVPSSYRIADAFKTANTLCKNPPKSDIEKRNLQGQVQEEFLQAFKSLGPIYLFNWNKIPGEHNNRLLSFIKEDLDIDKVKEIKKYGDTEIRITTKEKIIKIIIENNDKAILSINDGQPYELIVKNQNIYKSYESEISAEIIQLNTSADVVKLVANWCKEWQRYAQWTLYGNHGLNYAIGQLRVK